MPSSAQFRLKADSLEEETKCDLFYCPLAFLYVLLHLLLKLLAFLLSRALVHNRQLAILLFLLCSVALFHASSRDLRTREER